MLTEIYIARRYLFRGGARHISFIGIVACVGIALGVATLIVVISVMNGFDRDLMQRLLKFNYHLTIESVDPEQLARIEPIVESWDGIDSASRYLQTQIFAQFNSVIMPLVVRGVDFSDPSEKRTFDGYVTEERQDAGFFLGEGLRERFEPGEELSFYPLEKKLKMQTAPVRGFFEVGLYDVDNTFAITDLETAKSLSPNYLLFVGVKISEPFKAPQIKALMANTLGEGVYVTTWMEANQVLFSALQLEKATMFIILSLIVLVAAFNIFATVTMKVVEKTKDIGILRSMGLRRANIRAIFSLQGLLLGMIGTLLGTALGVGLCVILEKYPFIKLPGSIYAIDYLPVALRYRDISVIVALGIVLSFVFSWFPAVKASRLEPQEALRYE